MKTVITILIVLFFNSFYAQTFDTKLEKMSLLMANRLNYKEKLNIAVYPFYDRNKKQSNLSNLVSEDFTVYLNKYNRKFRIIDRLYMEQMMQEHKLNEEGLIDPATAKKFGMILAADVYITGSVTVFGSTFRIQVIAIDTQTGERVYSDSKKLPLDYDIAEFVGIDIKKREEEASLYKSANPDCEKQDVGDFCFVNEQNRRFDVNISDVSRMSKLQMSVNVAPNEKKCFLNLSSKMTYRYRVFTGEIMEMGATPQGQFQVHTCKSYSIIIK